MEITTLGIDLAKSVFQLHGVDGDGVVVLRKKLRRGAVLDCLRPLEPCLIGMEACASAHFWAREIAALGHEVRLIHPAYVKPYLRQKPLVRMRLRIWRMCFISVQLINFLSHKNCKIS